MESIYLFPFSFDGRRLFEGRQKFQSSSPTISPSMQNPVGSMEVPYLANTSFHLTLAIVLGAVLCTFLCLLVHYRHDCWSRWQLVLDPSFNPAVGGNVSMTNIDIEALPTTVYRTGLPFSAMNCPISLSESTGMVCPICLSEFVEGEKLRVLPGCCHSFHMDCVDAWLISSSTCPSCRQSLRDVRFKK